jgi:hypothetical protein
MASSSGELRDRGQWGVEVQIYREHEFLYGRHWPTRALALGQADDQRTAYLSKGGVLMS